MLPTTTSTLNNLLAMSQIEELVDELLDQEFSEMFRYNDLEVEGL